MLRNRFVASALVLGLAIVAGCHPAQRTDEALALRGVIERYRAEQGERCRQDGRPPPASVGVTPAAEARLVGAPSRPADERGAPFFLATFADDAATQPAARLAERASGREFTPPEGYWRRNVWHQMGREGLDFGTRGVWRGFKTAFWDVENLALLTATMGASVAIRETGVDDAIRRRTDGHRQLGDMDETIQILGNPGTHFAGAGVLWLTSTLTKDVKQHEVAKSLGEALAVNGLTTILLKVSANTRAPDGEEFAWPSGHTSSAFTAAAVLNEYYGPWVGIPSLALAGLVGYQRLDSRVHDFSDVVFGGMLGYVVGASIARDEKAKFPELFGMTVLPYQDPHTGAAGLALYKRF